MSWIFAGAIVLLFLLVCLCLFFWFSGAVVIADEEMESIRNKKPEELVDELIQTEQEDIDELKVEQKETRGFQ